MFLILSNWHSGTCIKLLEVWLVWVNYHIYDQLWILINWYSHILEPASLGTESGRTHSDYTKVLSIYWTVSLSQRHLSLRLFVGLHQNKTLSAVPLSWSLPSPLIIIVISSFLVPVKKYHPNLKILLQMQSEQHRIYHPHWTLFFYEWALNMHWLLH